MRPAAHTRPEVCMYEQVVSELGWKLVSDDDADGI